MTLITKTDELAAFCNSLQNAPWVAFDTEFLRVRTYRAQLCLVQLASVEQNVIVDALAEGMSLAPFYDLMARPELLKIVHAARQDIEIIVHESGQVPYPLFDTQVAAMVCGFGDAPSYASLVKAFADVSLDKSQQFTDWSQRPLSAAKCRYALDDVAYLGMIYHQLSSQMVAKGRTAWVAEEMAMLGNIATYRPDANDLWKRLSPRLDSPQGRNILQMLAIWRENEAQQRNRPRGHILKDEVLIGLAKNPPSDIAELTQSNILPAHVSVRAIFDLIEQAVLKPDSEAPPPLANRPRLKGARAATFELLKILLRHVSATHGVAQRLIATTEALENMVCYPQEQHAAFSGWRGEIFGNLAAQLMRGEIALTVNDGTVEIVTPTTHTAEDQIG